MNDINDCWLIPGCYDPNFPFWCPDSSCVLELSSCTSVSVPECTENQGLCLTGECKEVCNPYNGCLANKY